MGVIEIKQITEVAEALKLEDVQRQAWGMEEVEILPGRFLHGLQFNGSCLYGAFDGDRIVGFVFGLLGTIENLENRIDQVAAARLQMYSAIMGVIGPYQGQGIGYRLKLAQREFALRIGVRLITWTYDPLESRNAYLNMSKLGAVCHRYFRDFHGVLGGINAGVPTDRFYVEWWITSNRVKGKLSNKRSPLGFDAYHTGGATLVNQVKEFDDELPVPSEEFSRSEGNILIVEIPGSFQRVKQQDMALALAWREHTRQIFEYYIDRHYLVTDLVRGSDKDDHGGSYYILTHGDA
ncbi:MAG TPA: hypothetical protein VMZ24_01195 [Patescibacteria group bacterium]|nr:hypothetical protein [Patescibacteria group bacterium]